MAGLGAIGNIGQLVATLGLNTQPFIKGMDQAKKSMVAFNNGMMVVGRTMTRFVTLPMVLAGAAAIGTQKKFEASMTKIISLVGVSREQVEAWNKKVLEMATVTGRGPEELADALYFVTSAGIRGADALDVLEMSAKAAAVGLGDTKTIADLVTSAMNAYGKENLNAAQATDILVATVREGKAEAESLAGAMGFVLPIASEFGVTFDQVGAAFAGMTRTGTNARVAATQLKAILSTMAAPSQATADALNEANYSAADFRKTIREQGLIQALLDLRAATIGNEEAMAKIFPNIRALLGVLDLLGKNVDYNVQIFHALKNANGSLARAFAEVGGTVQQKLNVAMSTLKVTFVEIGNLLKPVVIDKLTKLNDSLKGLIQRVQTMTESQKKWNLVLVKFIALAGPALVIISRLVSIVTSAIGPYVLAAAAVVALATAIAKLVANNKSYYAIQKRSTEEQARVIENADKEAATVALVFARLKLAKRGTDEWKRAKDQINTQYASYLTNLITEASSLEDIERAQREVTKARQADVIVKGYQQEIERVTAEYEGAIEDKFKKYKKIVTDGRVELWNEIQKTPFDFSKAIDDAILEGVQMERKGVHFTIVRKKMREKAEELWDEYIAGLENAPKKTPARVEVFADALASAFSLKSSELEQSLGIQDAIDKILNDANVKNKELTVEMKIEGIDKQIKYMESVKGEQEEILRLSTLIDLHREKAALLTGDVKKGEEAIIQELQQELIKQKQIQSSLGIEERIKGKISKLEEARKKLSGDALEANSKALRAKQLELAEVQNETSGLSEIEKMRGRINIAKEKTLSLEGDQKKAALEQIRNDEKLVELMDARDSGLGNLAMKELELKQLKEDQVYMTEAESEQQQKLIDEKEKDIALTKNRIAGYNEMYQLQYQINQATEEANKLSGEDYKTAQKKIILQKIALLNMEASNDLLTEAEKRQKKILALTYERLLAEGKGKKEDIEKRLRQLRAEDSILSDIEARRTGEAPPLPNTREALQSLLQIHQTLKNLRDEGQITFREWFLAANENFKNIAGIFDFYFQKIGDIAKNFVDTMSTILEAQKQRELSAVGDNAKARERIEKKYYEKQKKWAISQAVINTALGVTKSLADLGPIAGAIAAALVVASGAAQVALIKAQSFAKGGLVYGETLAKVADYPSAKTNPEVIAPLSDLKKMLTPTFANVPDEIKLRAEGDDLVGVLRLKQLLYNTY